jgi:hypothetical protein
MYQKDQAEVPAEKNETEQVEAHKGVPAARQREMIVTGRPERGVPGVCAQEHVLSPQPVTKSG